MDLTIGDCLRMTMIRTFQPVGQGAFYTEQFCKDDGKAFNMVYDCGSDSLDIQSLSKVIKKSFPEGSVIDAVFISHFDSDHVNGLPEIMRNFKVNKIFLPLITGAAEIAYWRFKSDVDSLTEKRETIPVADRLLDPANDNSSEKIFRDFSCQNFPEIIRIQQLEGDARIEGDARPNEATNNACDRLGLPNWRFVPFNFKRFERESDFREILSEAISDVVAGTMVDEFIADPTEVFRRIGLKKSKELLKRINKITRERLGVKQFHDRFGDINGNSMTLYSGEREKEGQFSLSLCCRCNDSRKYKAGCLYMGDYAAKDNQAWESLVIFYDAMKCWHGIGCVQLPHHGSRHDFNPKIADMDVCSAVSFGLGNTHHHPGKDVILGLLQKNKTIILSTEANFYRNFKDVQQTITADR